MLQLAMQGDNEAMMEDMELPPLESPYELVGDRRSRKVAILAIIAFNKYRADQCLSYHNKRLAH